MDQQGLDIILVCSKRNVSYFSGWFQHLGSYWEIDDYGRPEIFFVGIPKDRNKSDFLICNSMFEIMDMYSYRDSYIRDRYYYGTYESVLDTMTSAGKIYDNPIDCVVQALKDRNLDRSCIGVEMDYASHASDIFSMYIHDRLRKALPDVTFRDASQPICQLRMIKSREEIERIRRAAEASECAVKTAFESLREGMTEIEFEKTIKKTLADRYSDYCMSHVVFNPSKYRACGKNICWATETKLHPGDVVWVDLVAGYRNYVSDMCRSKAFPRPNADVDRINKALIDTNEKLRDMIRPGLRCSDIFNFGNKLMEESGCSLSLKTVGHGIGVSIHEPPYLNSANNTLLEPDMVLALELMAEKEGLVIGLEDDILITDEGNEPITNLDRRIA